MDINKLLFDYSHPIIAVILQLVFAMFGASLWTGVLVAAFTFLMREVTQAEYNWIRDNGGLRAAMPVWKGLDVRLWSKHSILNVVWPIAATTVIATLFG